MNSDQVGSVVRSVLIALGTWAAAHGFTPDMWVAVTGGVVAAVSAVWGWWTHRTV